MAIYNGRKNGSSIKGGMCLNPGKRFGVYFQGNRKSSEGCTREHCYAIVMLLSMFGKRALQHGEEIVPNIRMTGDGNEHRQGGRAEQEHRVRGILGRLEMEYEVWGHQVP